MPVVISCVLMVPETGLRGERTHCRSPWRQYIDMLEMHKRYGNIVRIAPDELAFSHPDAWQDITAQYGQYCRIAYAFLACQMEGFREQTGRRMPVVISCLQCVLSPLKPVSGTIRTQDITTGIRLPVCSRNPSTASRPVDVCQS
jgi:hypothetical protein